MQQAATDGAGETSKSPLAAAANPPASSPPTLSPPQAGPLSLSPSALAAVQAFQRHRRGDYRSDRDTELQIAPDQLRQASAFLKRYDPRTWRYFKTQARWDYNSRRERLVVRTPSNFHESVIAIVAKRINLRVEEALQEYADRTKDGTAIKTWHKHVFPTGSPTVHLQPAVRAAPAEEQENNIDSNTRLGDRQCPDNSWKYAGPKYKSKNPNFVLEVAWSQTHSDLAEKSRRYIDDTFGDIRTVLAIKCSYSKKPTAPPPTYVSLYRYIIDEQGASVETVLDSMPISADRTSSVNLRLADFLPWDLTNQESQNQNNLQQLSNDIGDIALSMALFAEAVQDAYKVAFPKALSSRSEARQNARKRPREEDDNRGRPEDSSETSSFESTCSDSSYVPVAGRGV